jgi:hypothetical protein
LLAIYRFDPCRDGKTHGLDFPPQGMGPTATALPRLYHKGTPGQIHGRTDAFDEFRTLMV